MHTTLTRLPSSFTNKDGKTINYNKYVIEINGRNYPITTYPKTLKVFFEEDYDLATHKEGGGK